MILSQNCARSFNVGPRPLLVTHNPTPCRGLAFSDDSKVLYVAARDSIEVLDLTTKQCIESLMLTDYGKRDPGKLVQRRIPFGLGGPGDLYMSTTERIFSSKAPLHTFAVSSTRLLAVGSEIGEVTIYDLDPRRKLAKLPLSSERGAVESIAFNQQADRLALYRKGELYVFNIPGRRSAE